MEKLMPPVCPAAVTEYVAAEGDLEARGTTRRAETVWKLLVDREKKLENFVGTDFAYLRATILEAGPLSMYLRKGESGARDKG